MDRAFSYDSVSSVSVHLSHVYVTHVCHISMLVTDIQMNKLKF